MIFLKYIIKNCISKLKYKKIKNKGSKVGNQLIKETETKCLLI